MKCHSARGTYYHMQLTYQKFDLPLKHVFTISRGSVAVQEDAHRAALGRWRIRLRRGDDQFVYGATIENMSAAIESVRPLIEESGRLDDPLPLIAAIAEELPENDYAMFALSRSTRRFTICGASCAARRCISCGACRPTRFRCRTTRSASTRRRRWSPR